MSNTTRQPVGQVWLRRNLGLAVPRPAVESYIVEGARRTLSDGRRSLELYPTRYGTADSALAHLRFSLRHEAFDLGVLVAALRAIGPGEVETWVRSQPTGAFSRRAWFLYETFVGRTLDLSDASTGNYVAALDQRRHVVTNRRNSRRHRIADNLLGGPRLCPTVRLTPTLREWMASGVDRESHALTASCDPSAVIRAVSYLCTKETRSSFALEGETPNPGRAERFAAALKSAPFFNPSGKADLVRLQGTIVEPRYAARDWRDTQNFVGETIGGHRERVHFICPKPSDVPDLMDGWMSLTRRVVEGGVDPVIAAAASAFTFVLVHPFDDGNGRIHRFLIHHVLAKLDFAPSECILPVSAAILRDRRGYDSVLAGFSDPLLDLIRWEWAPETGDAPARRMVVRNETGDLYRYFDATAFAEYLYDRVAECVRRDLKDELGFVTTFDSALRGVREVVDMPDRRASLLVRLCMQNHGRLAARRRKHFEELADAELAEMELAVRKAMADAPPGSDGGSPD